MQADLRYPDVRRVIIDCLREFADDSQQQEGAFFDAADDLDHLVGENARSGIGEVFYSEAEADAAGAAVEQLNGVLNHVGPSPTIPDIKAHPEWPAFVAAATAALSVIDSHPS